VRVPKGSRDTVRPGHIRGLKKRSCPGPLGDDDGGCKSRLDHTPGRVEMLGGDISFHAKVLIEKYDSCGDDRKQGSTVKNKNCEISWRQFVYIQSHTL